MDSNQPVKYATIIPLIGGMTLGNKEAVGHNPEMFLTYNGFQANDSHIRAYMPDVPYLTINDENTSIKDSNDRGLFNEIVQGGIDFVSAVPPCSALSMLNKGTSEGSRGADAPSSRWLDKTSEFVLENIRPKVLFGENAPGLFGKIGEGVVLRLEEIARKYNYSFSMVKTNTLYHGIPQRRDRTFYFFWDSKYAPVMTQYHRPRKTLWEYLEEVPQDALYMDTGKLPENNPYLNFMLSRMTIKEFTSQDQWHTVQNWIVRERLWEDFADWGDKNGIAYPRKRLDYIRQKVKDAGFPDDNEALYRAGLWDQTPGVVRGEYINAVIGKNRGRLFHANGERFINTREDMHLMGLPHDFVVLRGDFHHITQNVPVTTARDQTLEVIKYIKGELFSSNEKSFRQINDPISINSIARNRKVDIPNVKALF